ncbi:MAG: protein-export membrane protein SecF [Sulfurimonas sp. RIFOXYD12_FULL_33_39]|uniref:protein translocase subunit SecF n=1 Tax=unclassified Sulfurimonas TaxID=2623549 RepID=UPI0008C954BC|nr:MULTISPECIES: protein translocase subunit SecF [unclassified Sulfurimonas]OHE07529.1 MAG: protein-export membrane protein SecF [Sulfurimonas sp. RIFCSPLOWO2_12_FULL_34_6]OHE08693.1 MAG: protein-export membrane protein SecF [Sulfurimonas sp. RIFOXYD12_FULL_33_39]OHE13978.1 MAG: protein-export membrane protein SecF [Sulfurimonas sp. RIFOXYD2_FULL_34_21]DAB27611.1 MAG TPA: protein translocase subunit SecF [Sulfurimonas sp. UBA10385]
MEFFKYTRTFNFMGKSKLAMILSIVMVLGSFVVLATKGLNYGVDFAGGTIVQVKYNSAAPIDTMREKLKGNEIFEGASITEFGSKEEVVIRMRTTTGNVTVDIGDVTREALKDTGEFEIRRVDIVGPKVGSELKEKGIMSLFLAILGILIYVAFRFEWRFALASIIALVHDISIAAGAIALVGLEVNLDVLAALLTILGYSLNDTIIVFDRIREGITKNRDTQFSEIIDDSITNTLSRTTLTSLTTLFVVFTLFMFGGEIIHAFAFTLLVGIVVGTYSSIFVASPILLVLGFDVKNYHVKLAEKAKREAEKERMRSQFESGVM